MEVELAASAELARLTSTDKDQQIRALKVLLEETLRQLQTSKSDRSRQSNQITRLSVCPVLAPSVVQALLGHRKFAALVSAANRLFTVA